MTFQGRPYEICVLLWARSGMENELADYETDVLQLLCSAYGDVVYRGIAQPADANPTEVHVLRFHSRESFDGFTADPRRQALAARRTQVIDRTMIVEIAMQGAAPQSTPAPRRASGSSCSGT